MGSEAPADHVHVINAGPGVVAAVRNETKILNLFPITASPHHEKKRGAKRSRKTQHPQRKDLSFVYRFFRKGREGDVEWRNALFNLDLEGLHPTVRNLIFK